jgi:hypothetical protein
VYAYILTRAPFGLLVLLLAAPDPPPFRNPLCEQPSPDTFALASKVVLLAQGRVCYCGSVREVASYFQSPNMGFAGESFSNVADFVIAVVGGALIPNTGTRALTPLEMADKFKKSPYFMGKPMSEMAFIVPVDSAPSFPTSLANQCRVLVSRGWMTQWRQKDFIKAQLAKNLVVAVVCGIIFYGLGSQPVPSVSYNKTTFSVSSILYFAMMYTILSNLQAIPQVRHHHHYHHNHHHHHRHHHHHHRHLHNHHHHHHHHHLISS